MAQIVTKISDYDGHTIPRGEETLVVKVTVKVGNEAGKSYELDFSKDDYDAFVEKLESTKGENPEPLIPKSKPAVQAPGAPAGESRTLTVEQQEQEDWKEAYVKEHDLADDAARTELREWFQKTHNKQKQPLKDAVEKHGDSDKTLVLRILNGRGTPGPAILHYVKHLASS